MRDSFENHNAKIGAIFDLRFLYTPGQHMAQHFQKWSQINLKYRWTGCINFENVKIR